MPGTFRFFFYYEWKRIFVRPGRRWIHTITKLNPEEVKSKCLDWILVLQ